MQSKPDLVAIIDACTSIIGSPTETPETHAFTLMWRGIAYSRKGDDDLALLDLDQAIRAMPRNELALAWRGIVFDRKGDYDRAIQDFGRVIRETGNSAMAFNSRGIAYHHKGDYGRAIQDYDSALELIEMRIDNQVPQIHARILNNRALARWAAGDVAGANADAALAREIDPLARCTTSPSIVLAELCFSNGAGK